MSEVNGDGHEKELRAVSGWVAVAAILVAGVGVIFAMVNSPTGYGFDWIKAVGVALLIFDGLLLAGLTVVNPNEASVVTLFGVYKGTIKRAGLWWVNPLTTRRKLSLRVRNFESAKLKVNERDGNPIEIAAVVVWRIVDTFEAASTSTITRISCTSRASRQSGNSHEFVSLRIARGAQVSLRLSAGGRSGLTEVRARDPDSTVEAGIDVIEARLSHLAYAPEIAHAMLRRQQASAVIAARSRIVEGAVGMVEMALEMLNQKNVVHLDEERKAAMVSNLMVVLCGDRDVSPVVNAGTLHH